jgi:ribose transport system ATP-binding protein
MRLIDLSKSFGSVRVLGGVSLDLSQGEVHAIVGENGAGKSTLMHILTGSQRPDEGRIETKTHTTSGWTDESAAIEAGIGIVYQERSLFPHLSIAENIFAGRPLVLGGEASLFSFLGRINFAEMRKRARALLDEVGLECSPDTLVSSLSQAQQQQVEIAKALSLDAKLLILDEPTACLSNAEVEQLFRCLLSLKKKGVTILYVSHRLEEVFTIADRVSVLKDGVLQRTIATTDTSPRELVSLMVGRPWDASQRRAALTRDDAKCVLDVRELTDTSSNGLLKSIRFRVHAGEIVAIAGLVGSGRSEVAMSLFGARHPIQSDIEFDGIRYSPKDPSDAMRHGLALLTEDRRSTGMFAGLSLSDNLVSAAGDRFGNWNWKSQDAKKVVASMMMQLRIVCKDADQPLLQLSGGNQQKVLLSRWLIREPKLLILDEPSRGVDVAAKDEIHGWIKRLADHGTGILLISSDLTEVLALADTIVVLHEGRCVGACQGETATEESIMALASMGTELRL